MDIKEEIAKIEEKLKSDPQLMQSFKDDPVKAVEGVIGVDLPDDVVKKVVDGLKVKLSADKLGGAVDAIKKLF